MSLKKISYEIFSKVVDFFQKIVTNFSEGATPFFPRKSFMAIRVPFLRSHSR